MSRSRPIAEPPEEDSTTKPSSRRVAKGRAAREQVDAIFSQWQAERPDIDASPVHVYGLIGRIQIKSTPLIEETPEALRAAPRPLRRPHRTAPCRLTLFPVAEADRAVAAA